MGVFPRSVDSFALVGQAEGLALGGSHQPSVDQLSDRSVNVGEVVKQSAREGGRLDVAFAVRGVDDFILKLS